MSAPDVAPYEGLSNRRGFNGGTGPRPAPSGAKPSSPGRAAEIVAAAPRGQVVVARIVDEATERPIGGAKCAVVSAAGKVVAEVTTAYDGVVRVEVKEPGPYDVEVRGLPEPPAEAPGEAQSGAQQSPAPSAA